ncbi:DUF2971 domain-containing protein [Aeromonas caviae]
MTILYKYYSAAFDLEKYILDPTIRLTQTSGLNDPFEGKISAKAMEIICKRFTLSENFTPRDTEEETLKALNDIIEDMMRSRTVVSLTETQRNLLMWAHYASEHRGCCIGYEADIFNGLDILDRRNSYSYQPVKVNYDTITFDDEQITQLKKNAPIENDEFTTILNRSMRTKNDAWIYEKEHRLITPVEWSDKIILKNSNALPKYVTEPLLKIKNSDLYNVYDDEQDTVIIPVKNKNRLWPEKNGIRSYENLLAKYKDTIFIKNIKKERVNSIYLGVYYPQTKQRVLEKLIKDKSNGLSHIKLYRCELSTERFELIQNRVEL